MCVLLGLLLGLLAQPALAHSFGSSYALPIPFAFYAWGAALALVVSFVILAVGAASSLKVTHPAEALITIPADTPARRSLFGRALQAVSVLLLVLTIATGLFGSQDSFTNFSMTFFWIVFVLGVTYAVALLGDFYALANPWRALCDSVEALWPGVFAGRITGSSGWGDWPALLLYIGFICVELFAHSTPQFLAAALLVYTAINVLGAALVGKEAWFRHGEFFAVFLRWIGTMAPIARTTLAEGGRPVVRVRAPFVGLLAARVTHTSGVLFILFMLASTVFDAIRETRPWVKAFWAGILPSVAHWLPAAEEDRLAAANALYDAWQWLGLLASPFLYFGVFAGFMWLTKSIARSYLSTLELTRRFAPTLVPIAFVFHVTHYYTLLLSQGPQIGRLVSDPFGAGWDLFGTVATAMPTVMVDAGTIWHTQVAMIVIGHLASVYLAHCEALRTFSRPRDAIASQIPMLLLMMALTVFGLWILSLPLSAGPVGLPPSS